LIIVVKSYKSVVGDEILYFWGFFINPSK